MVLTIRLWMQFTVLVGLFFASGHILANQSQPSIQGTQLTISGVDGEVKENVAAHLLMKAGLVPLSSLGFPRSDGYIVSKAEQALQALGYYRPTASLSGEGANKTLNIALGVPTRWHEVTITAVGSCTKLPQVSSLIESHPIKKGQIVHHGAYADHKSAILNTAFADGYLDARFEHARLAVDMAKQQADVYWQFDCGEQYKVSAMNIEGTELAHELLMGYIQLKPGEPYRQEAILRDQQALNRTGLFQSIVIEPDIDDKSKTVALNLKVRDADKYQLKTRVGYATDIGGSVGISWQDMRVNRQGHHYTLGSAWSVPDKNISLQYKIPLKKDKSEWINRLGYQVKDEELGKTTTRQFSTRYIQQLDSYWSSQWGFNLAAETVTGNTLLEEKLEYLVPFWQINYFSVADPFAAEQGWRWSAKFSGTVKDLSNPDIDFLQIEQQAKAIWPLQPNWRLLLRGKAGITLADTETALRAMPSQYRFFAGGDVSVRGYSYQSLSPTDELATPLGGKHVLEASAEVDYRLSEDIRLALFADVGNAFNDWRDWSVNRSIGTGIRWVTPVGSIRLDVAKALDRAKGWRLHITIGPDL